jgi:hypothetical protein
MSFPEIYERFVYGMLHTSWLEYIAVFTGIASVWFSKIENIWLYPVGLISTIIYTYLSLVGPLIRRSECKHLLHHHEHLWLAALDQKRRAAAPCGGDKIFN